MRLLHRHRIAERQRGQAATEFVIASAFLLVPLFLIIPILGKYIDIRHAAINKARFEAWEYTVWNIPGQDPRVKIKAKQSAGQRPYEDTRARGMHYFFSNPNSASYADPNSVFESNPLWVDHKDESLFASPQAVSGDIVQTDTPATFGRNSPDVLNFLVDGMNVVTSIFDEMLTVEQVDGKFDILKAEYRKNYVQSHVNVSLRSLDDILPRYTLGTTLPAGDLSPVVIHAKAAVLTDSWDSGSTINARTETRGLVFTAFLRPLSRTINKIVNGLNNGLSHIPLISIKLPSMPNFGYVDDDTIPLEFLEESPKETKEKYQLNYYE